MPIPVSAHFCLEEADVSSDFPSSSLLCISSTTVSSPVYPGHSVTGVSTTYELQKGMDFV